MILHDTFAIQSQYVRSIWTMLGYWERYFSWPFCLTQRQTSYLEVCLSAGCVVWRRDNNRKYMTRNPTSIYTDRTFRFSRLPESIGKNTKVFIQSHFKPSGKKNSLCTPLPFGNLSLLDPPTPRKFCDPPWGGDVDVFWNHTLRLQLY